MKIKGMFQKDIGRPIQGVVKIGQDSVDTITVELDEYVVTKELNRHFDKFFAGYRRGTQHRTDKMGVWISGFFGSGKSHFLKILSYLLGDNVYDGAKAIDFFSSKIEGSRIMADMQTAAGTNADVILFNIDAEADSDSKANKDPIVKVFMKVFNKMQGFCSTMPWIADLERQMEKDGKYDAFRARFKELAGSDWEYARNDFYFEQDNVVNALSDATKMSIDAALAWYNKAEEHYALDINSFARKVREYIEAKEQKTGKKHFVVFLCDEVGQYVGSSGALMLNLQNIVEGLGNECGGQAWVICTGQEDIDSLTNVNRDAFSKIIGRFDTRLSLSSANVDEVIKKRLLAKTETAAEMLRLVYSEKEAVLKNLITFSQDTPEKRLYDSAGDFADIYPFVPYQFNLLQAVFNGIRTHGASGKHLSEGERSLLSAFQEAAMQYSNSADSILIPFEAFYPTVETFLDHNIRKVILDAEDSAHRGGALRTYDVEVLKVLFMVKYIPNVLPANLENITTVMLQYIDEDKIEAKKKVDASLRRLEEQKLIIKNGDQFIFLTNEEQDINREIREIRIDQSEIVDKVGSEIFSVLFGVNKKFRYSERHDFGFNTIIDDRPLGAQKEEIGLRVITPVYAHGGADDMEMKGMSLRERNVIACLPPDTGFLDEMEQSLQIETFIRRNSGRAASDTIEDIKTTKIREGKQRAMRCRDLIAEALKKAALYVNGNRLGIKEKPPEQRINDAFRTLVESIYTKQNYINQPYPTVDSLRAVLAEKDSQLIIDGTEQALPNHLALTEMIEVIERIHFKNLPATMRSLSEQFGKIPYGWKDMDIAGTILTLLKKQKIRFEMNGENITADDVNAINYVTKREYLDRLVVKWRDIVNPALIANAKDIAKEVFCRSDIPSDEDGLMSRIKGFAAAELSGNNDSIKDLLHEYSNSKRYPGRSVLESGKKLLEQIEKTKETRAFYEYLHNEKEAMLDYAEDVQDVKKFFENQRTIFDKALNMLDIYEGNRAYVLDAETIGLVDAIEKITRSKEPYSEIHKLPELTEMFMLRFVDLLDDECKPIRANIEADYEAVKSDLSKRPFEKKFTESARYAFSALLDKLSHTNNIVEAHGLQATSDRVKQQLIQSFNDEEALRFAESASADAGKPAPSVRKMKTVSMKSLLGRTCNISNTDDIDRLLSELRKKLEAQIEEDTTIQLV
ncbi:MAG: BREX system P-loop protein BrxC [Clostridiales bacterium]|nr:BREX system P-loop protein BrxC [Clostridiales bacterium]